MTLTEYNTIYSQQVQRIVETYVAKKYETDESIVCYFAPYHVYTGKDSAYCFEPTQVLLSKEDYTTLLLVVVKHRNLQFQELPLYVSKKLYRHILESFNFVNILEQDAHPFALEVERDPIAIAMTTLMNDAKEIIGEDEFTMCLQSCAPYKDYDEAYVNVNIWMGIMEISIYRIYNGDISHRIASIKHKDIYGMIDANSIMSALKVEKCENVPYALWRLLRHYTANDKSDITWIIRWLDAYKINYTYAHGTLQMVYDGYNYKYREVEL